MVHTEKITYRSPGHRAPWGGPKIRPRRLCSRTPSYQTHMTFQLIALTFGTFCVTYFLLALLTKEVLLGL
jgi:hypothetical protein